MDKEQYIKFSDAQIGSTINRPVLVSAIAENTARNGNIFVKVSLKDGFSEVTAMMFDASQESLASLGIRQNTIADAELSVSEYQGSKSFKIVQIRPTADSTLTVNNFTKLPPVDLDLMYSEICSMIESSANDYYGNYTPLSDLALKILTKLQGQLHDFLGRYLDAPQSQGWSAVPLLSYGQGCRCTLRCLYEP